MLRLHHQGDSEELSRLYHPKHTKPAYSLHSMGEELSVEVRGTLEIFFETDELTSVSEIFGASEDESPEMDHSEDSENGRTFSLRHWTWTIPNIR